MSTKKKLSLEEALSLEAELSGFRNERNEIVIKGLLSQKLNLALKYKLSQLAKQVAEDRKFFNDQVAELRADLGTPEEIAEIAKNPLHEKNIAFQNQLRDFLVNTERNVEIPKISIADFAALETEEYYPILFGLIG